LLGQSPEGGEVTFQGQDIPITGLEQKADITAQAARAQAQNQALGQAEAQEQILRQRLIDSNIDPDSEKGQKAIQSLLKLSVKDITVPGQGTFTVPETQAADIASRNFAQQQSTFRTGLGFGIGIPGGAGGSPFFQQLADRVRRNELKFSGISKNFLPGLIQALGNDPVLPPEARQAYAQLQPAVKAVDNLEAILNEVFTAASLGNRQEALFKADQYERDKNAFVRVIGRGLGEVRMTDEDAQQIAAILPTKKLIGLALLGNQEARLQVQRDFDNSRELFLKIAQARIAALTGETLDTDQGGKNRLDKLDRF
jgi:hypothetical protein